jgi:gliding motility-associated protein GldL
MAKKKSFFESKGWKNGMKYLYGWGASVVIVGALFKILHLPGANEMLIVGLTTEAAIFFISAFEPLPHEEVHYLWERAYPQIHPDFPWEEGELTDLTPVTPGGGGGGGGMGGLDIMKNIPPEKLEEIKSRFTPDLFISLSDTIKHLRNGLDDISRIGDATVATDEFQKKIKDATAKVDKLSVNYGTTADAMAQFSTSMSKIKTTQESISKDILTYHQQIQTITKNLSSLNAVYEIELQDAQKHINSVTKFYGSISGVMQNLLDTSKDTDKLRKEVASLADNMTRLNTIYGNMLTAMAAGGSSAKS